MLNTLAFEPQKALAELKKIGATAFSILDAPMLDVLAKEAHQYHFADRSGVVGKENVRQEFAAFNSFPAESAFYAVRYMFTRKICEVLMASGASFDPWINFNEMVLQRYPAGSSGITTHIDSKRCKNLVVVFPLEGDGDFAICDDRAGRNATVIHAPPGHVILMAAIGFCSRTEQKFHFLSNIRKGRLTFAMRQLDPPGSLW